MDCHCICLCLLDLSTEAGCVHQVRSRTGFALAGADSGYGTDSDSASVMRGPDPDDVRPPHAHGRVGSATPAASNIYAFGEGQPVLASLPVTGSSEAALALGAPPGYGPASGSGLSNGRVSARVGDASGLPLGPGVGSADHLPMPSGTAHCTAELTGASQSMSVDEERKAAAIDDREAAVRQPDRPLQDLFAGLMFGSAE